MYLGGVVQVKAFVGSKLEKRTIPIDHASLPPPPQGNHPPSLREQKQGP